MNTKNEDAKKTLNKAEGKRKKREFRNTKPTRIPSFELDVNQLLYDKMKEIYEMNGTLFFQKPFLGIRKIPINHLSNERIAGFYNQFFLNFLSNGRRPRRFVTRKHYNRNLELPIIRNNPVPYFYFEKMYYDLNGMIVDKHEAQLKNLNVDNPENITWVMKQEQYFQVYFPNNREMMKQESLLNFKKRDHDEIIDILYTKLDELNLNVVYSDEPKEFEPKLGLIYLKPASYYTKNGEFDFIRHIFDFLYQIIHAYRQRKYYLEDIFGDTLFETSFLEMATWTVLSSLYGRNIKRKNNQTYIKEWLKYVESGLDIKQVVYEVVKFFEFFFQEKEVGEFLANT